jgi:hypothetical protein
VRRRSSILTVLFAFILGTTAAAQTPASDPPRPPRMTFSGYVQPQYEVRSQEDDTRDRAILRRMLFGTEIALTPSWSAEFMVDAGPVASTGDGRLIVKDAYLRYDGLERHGVSIFVGNQKMPFSRALLGSSSRRGLIERPIGGDRSLGSPGRAIGVLADGWHRRRTIRWTASLASSLQSPDADEVRIDGIAEAHSNWNAGALLGGRFELHPLGEVSRAQSDFGRGALTVVAAVAAYSWRSGEGAPRHQAGTVDADHVRGLEFSGGVRGHGVSVDAEFEHIAAVAMNRDVTLGLYVDGRAAIDKMSVEGGYMVIPRRLEPLLGFDAASSRSYAEPWRRVNAGMNWYVNGHRLKFSLMHRQSFNERGVRNERSHTTYLQAQFSY